MDMFGKFGAINSVKVMWPRTEEERARKRNCGFVSFKRRCDAEEALLELQDAELEEYRMVICWGKAVRISSTPFTLPSSRSAPAVPSPVPVVAIAAAVPPPPLLQSIVAVPPSTFLPRPPPPPFPSCHPTLTQVLPPAAVPLMPPVVVPPVADRVPVNDHRSHMGATADTLVQTSTGDCSGMSIDAFMESVASSSSSVASQPSSSAPLPPPPATLPVLVASLPTADDHHTVHVSIPSNSATRALIDLVAQYTAADGHAFETVCVGKLYGWISSL